jgi:copper chaperone
VNRAILVSLAALTLGAAVVLAFHGAAGSEKGDPPLPAGPAERVLLSVQGLSCGSCEARIRETLAKTPGIRAVGVSLAKGQVTVEYTPGMSDPRDLAQSLTRLGYPARFVASGSSVPAPGKAGTGSVAGCGGTCCARTGAL